MRYNNFNTYKKQNPSKKRPAANSKIIKPYFKTNNTEKICSFYDFSNKAN